MAKQEIREFGDFTGENDQGYVIVGGKTADIEGGKKLLSDIVPVVPEQVNADWNAESGKAQILNKPTIPSKTSDLTNDSNFITLNDIPAQAQADWDEKDDSEPSFIANKPFDEVNGSGGLDIIQGSLVVQIDKKTIKRTDGGTLYVANPVPEPLSDHSDRGKVLTVQQASDPNNPDEIVWAAPAGGGLSLPNMQEIIGKNGDAMFTEDNYTNVLELVSTISVDEDGKISSVSAPKWRIDLQNGSGQYYYFT